MRVQQVDGESSASLGKTVDCIVNAEGGLGPTTIQSTTSATRTDAAAGEHGSTACTQTRTGRDKHKTSQSDGVQSVQREFGDGLS